jgi:hypothetical protein
LNKLLSISALLAATSFTAFGTYDRYTAHTKQKEALFNSYFNVCAQEVERASLSGRYASSEILELRKACGVGAKAFADDKADYTVLGRSWTFDKESQMYVEVFK